MSPNDSLPTKHTPDTPEQARERALLREWASEAQKARDIATIKTLLDKNPDKETLEKALKMLIEKDPRARKDIEKAAVNADVEFLEALAKIAPLDHKWLAHLEKQREAQMRLRGTSQESSEKYPKDAVVLTKDQIGMLERKYGELSKLPVSQSKPKEVLEAEQQLTEKLGQANLLLSVGQAYRDYLTSLEAGIRFKNLSDKPKRYQEQIRAIDQALKTVASVGNLPENERASAIRKLDIKTLANTVFVPETKLSTFGSGFMNQPMLEIDAETHEVHGHLNLSKTLAETEGRYDRMKALVTESWDWSEGAAKKRKYEMLSLLRLNDSRDDDSMKLNSGEAIAKQTEGDVLKNPILRKNERIRQDFDTIAGLQKNPQAKAEFQSIFFGDKTPAARDVEIFFQKYGIDLSKESQTNIVSKWLEYRKDANSLVEKEKDRLVSIIDKPGQFPKELIAEFKKDPIKKTREILYGNLGNTLFEFASREVIMGALKTDPKTVTQARNADQGVKLYTNIVGLTHTSDEVVNNRITTSEFFLEQAIIMYLSGFAGGQAIWFVRGVAGVKDATTLASVFEGWAAGLTRGKRALAFTGETAIDGGTFAVSYSTLTELSNHGYVDKNTLSMLWEVMWDGNNWNDNTRIVAFLGVMKAMMPVFAKIPNPQDMVGRMIAQEFPELAVKIGKTPTLAKGLTLSRTAIQGIENITLDTAALLGTDTVIRWLKNLTLNMYESVTGNEITNASTFKKEDLMQNTDEISNYLMQEFKAIVLYVVALRGVSGEIFRGNTAPDITKQANAQILVNIERNGDLTIRTLEGRVVVIKKELQSLDLRRERLVASGKKSHGEKQEIAQVKREKKAELKDAMAEVDGVEQFLKENYAQNAQILGDSAVKDSSHDTSLAGVGTGSKDRPQMNSEEGATAKTSTNHSTKNVKELDFEPRSIRLSDVISEFKPSSLDTKKVAGKFGDLLKDMKNVESPELLRMQAESILQKELQTKFDDVHKTYSDYSPESQAKIDAWRENLSSQSKELARDFENALRTKLNWGKMDAKWWDSGYMDRVMGMFAKEASSQLKAGMKDTSINREHENKIPE